MKTNSNLSGDWKFNLPIDAMTSWDIVTASLNSIERLVLDLDFPASKGDRNNEAMHAILTHVDYLKDFTEAQGEYFKELAEDYIDLNAKMIENEKSGK